MREIPERSEESVTTEERREAGERREAQERREAEAQRLVRKVTESTVSVLLECGHRNTVHVASSGFDFPGDEQHCDECGTGRLMHPDLVARLVEAQAPPPEFPDLTDDAPRTEPCALCGEPTSHNYALQAEPTGGLGFVECWVFLCPRHTDESR